MKKEVGDQKYPIDKIIVMTLDRSIERKWAFLGASSIVNIDPSMIYFAIGKDNLDYKNDMYKVAEAATIDGFSFVKDYARGMQSEFCKQTAASACQVWNYCRVLRYLHKTNQTGLIIFDDKMISVDFEQLMEMVDEIKEGGKDKTNEFFAMQLMLRGEEDVLHLPEMTPKLRKSLTSEFFSWGEFGQSAEYYRPLLFQNGITGYDETFIFSPEGADWFLRCLDLAPDFYMFLDHFICFGMPAYAKQATNRRKGVYCPSEVSYKFVKTYMDFPTTTDWATKDSNDYEQAHKPLKLNYIFDEPKSKIEVREGINIEQLPSADAAVDLQKQLKGVVNSKKESDDNIKDDD